MRFIVDRCAGRRLAEWLQGDGHDGLDTRDLGPDFLRLANALSALYPRGCEEKRLLDGMLLAVPR